MTEISLDRDAAPSHPWDTAPFYGLRPTRRTSKSVRPVGERRPASPADVLPAESRFETEAESIADALYSRKVPKESVLIERISANTSENFWLSAELLRDNGLDPQRFLVVQKPYAERRTLATARRRWPSKEVRVTSEIVEFDKYCAGDIPIERILSMLAGEVLPSGQLCTLWSHRCRRTDT